MSVGTDGTLTLAGGCLWIVHTLHPHRSGEDGTRRGAGMADAMQRVRRALGALADALGAEWRVAEGEPYPALGLGESDGYRRLALIREGPPRQGLEVWSQGGDWRWLVDGGAGLLRGTSDASLLFALEAAWHALWSATVDPFALIAELLRSLPGQSADVRRRLAELGAPQVSTSTGCVLWGASTLERGGPITIVLDATRLDATTAQRLGVIDDWPLVRHGTAVRHVRQACSPAELAARLAGLAVAYASRGLAGGVPVFPAAGSYCALPVKAPPLPSTVSEACGCVGALVDDWRSRLRAVLAEESQRGWAARWSRINQRAKAVITLPSSDEADDDEGGGGLRLDVPVDVVAALWALGLSLRTISAITTGRDTSRTTLQRWIKDMRSATRVWSWWGVAADVIDHLELGWARSWCGDQIDAACPAGGDRDNGTQR